MLKFVLQRILFFVFILFIPGILNAQDAQVSTPPVAKSKPLTESELIDQAIQDAQTLGNQPKNIENRPNVLSKSGLAFGTKLTDKEETQRLKEDFDGLKEKLISRYQNYLLSNDHDSYHECYLEILNTKYEHNEFVDLCINLSKYLYPDQYLDRIQVKYDSSEQPPKFASVFFNKESQQYCFRHSLELLSTVSFFLPKGMYYEGSYQGQSYQGTQKSTTYDGYRGFIKCDHISKSILLDRETLVYRVKPMPDKKSNEVKAFEGLELSINATQLDDKNRICVDFSATKEKREPYESEDVKDLYFNSNHKKAFLNAFSIKEIAITDEQYITHKDGLILPEDVKDSQLPTSETEVESSETDETLNQSEENERSKAKTNAERDRLNQERKKRMTYRSYQKLDLKNLNISFEHGYQDDRIYQVCFDSKPQHQYKIEIQPSFKFMLSYEEIQFVPKKIHFETIVTRKLLSQLSISNTKFILPYKTKEIPIAYQNLNQLYAQLYRVDKSNLVHLMRDYDINRPNRLKQRVKSSPEERYFRNNSYYWTEASSYSFINTMVQNHGTLVWNGTYQLLKAKENESTQVNLPIPIDLTKYPSSFFFLVLKNTDQHLVDQAFETKQKIEQDVESGKLSVLEGMLKNINFVSKEADAEVYGTALNGASHYISDHLYYHDDGYPFPYALNRLDRLEELLWIIPSDIGIQSIETADGHHVKALGIEKQEPLANINISVLANHNQVIAQRKTDQQGDAFFPKAIFEGKKGEKAMMITAENDKGELTVLSLKDHLLEDSLEQASTWEQKKGMVFLNRGIYRLGEEVQTLVNVRDGNGKGKESTVLLQLISDQGFFNANNYVSLSDAVLLKTNELGVLEHIFKIPENALSGDWRVVAYDYQKLKALFPPFHQTHLLDISPTLAELKKKDIQPAFLGEAIFKVDYIKPAEFKINTKILNPLELSQASSKTNPYQLEITGKYNFGGVLDQVKVEAELYFVKVDQPRYFKKDGFFFGFEEEEEFANLHILNPVFFNSEGKTILNIPIVDKPDSLSPREVKVKLRVFENGNMYEQVVFLPHNLRKSEIGIKFFADRKNLENNEPFILDMVSTNYRGEPLPKQKLNIHWEKLVDYQSYLPIYTEQVETNDQGEYRSQAPYMEYGRYRIRVSNPSDGAVTEYRFRFNDADYRWYEYEYEEDDESYVEGYDTHHLNRLLNIRQLEGKVDSSKVDETQQITAEFQIPTQGYLQLKLADRAGIFWQKEYRVDFGQQKEVIDIPKDKQLGVNLIAIFIKDSAMGLEKIPKRMLFQKWIPLKVNEFKAELEWDIPKHIPSQNEYEFNYEIKNANPKEKLYLSLWLVDDAILEYTNYQLKNLLSIIFHPKSIPIKIYDIYNHIAERIQLPKAQLKFGGDLYIDMDSLKDNDKILSERTGLLEVPPSGKGKIKLNIPKFKGRARLTAYVFGEKKFAAKEAKLIIREDAVVDVHRPEFLTLEDKAEANIVLHYFLEKPQTVKLSVKGSENLALEPTSWEPYLSDEQKFSAKIPIRLKDYGEANITATLEIPGKPPLVESFSIQSRAPWTKEHLKQSFYIPPKQSQSISLFKDQYTPSTAKLQLTIANEPMIDIHSLLDDLNTRESYSNINDLLSTVFPKLYYSFFSRVYPSFQYDEETLKTELEESLDQLNAFKKENGLFGINRYSVNSSMQASTYALHYLMQLKQSYPTDFDLDESTKDIIGSLVSYHYQDIESDYYRLYVLSAYQLISRLQSLEVLNQFKPKPLNDLISALKLAPANEQMKIKGQLQDEMIKHVMYKAILNQFNLELQDQGEKIDFLNIFKLIELNNLAVLGRLLFFAHQSQSYQSQIFNIMEYIIKVQEKRTYLSPDELSWLLLGIGKSKESINAGKPWQALYQGELIQNQNIYQKQLQGGNATLEQSFTNQSSWPIWVQLQGSAIKKTQPEPLKSEILIRSIQYFDKSGKEIDRSQPLTSHVGDDWLVKINLEYPYDYDQYSYLDVKALLPAGWIALIEDRFTAMISSYRRTQKQALKATVTEMLLKKQPKKSLTDDSFQASTIDPDDLNNAINEKIDREDPLLKNICMNTPSLITADQVIYRLDISQHYGNIDPLRQRRSCALLYAVKHAMPGHFIIPELSVVLSDHPEIRSTTTSYPIHIMP